MAVEHIRLSLLCLGQVWVVFLKVVWGRVGFVGFRGSEGYVDRSSSAPSIPQLLFAPVFDACPLISRLIAIVLVGETYGFYLSNALTHQPISSRHGADVLSRF